METLFPLEPNYPKGFSYFPDFLSVEEEEALIRAVQSTELHIFNFQGFEAKRKVASFGYDYSFDQRKLTKGKDIPAAFHSLVNKVADKIGKDATEIAELLVIEYPVGAVINWHRDAPPFGLIAGVSLLSDCLFKLRPYEKSLQNRKAIKNIPVKRRSLYIMDGASRSEWEHSTAPVKSVRYSITLRTLKK